jgi:hypothetical protein
MALSCLELWATILGTRQKTLNRVRIFDAEQDPRKMF